MEVLDDSNVDWGGRTGAIDPSVCHCRLNVRNTPPRNPPRGFQYFRAVVVV